MGVNFINSLLRAVFKNFEKRVKFKLKQLCKLFKQKHIPAQKAEFKPYAVNNRTQKPSKQARKHIIAHHAKPATYIFIHATDDRGLCNVKKAKEKKG